jgi:hypothetical protein
MKETIKTSIVSNTRPVYIALPVEGDENHDFEVMLEPIVAWKIRYNDNESNNANFAEPILNSLSPDKYAIYDYETEIWSIPDYTSGKGLDTLAKYFKEILQ